MANSPLVSIVIPTFRRPDRVLGAARSALAQKTDASFELVLVDNDPARSALMGLRALAASTATQVTVVHEPAAGVANARNAGLRAARGQLIAFLDDDEIAPPTWLGELLRVQRAHDADVVFGPVHTRLAEEPIDHAEFFDDFFARHPDHAEGPIDDLYGCGCSLVRRAALPSPEPFSVKRNEIGGEDDLLFQAMHRAGRRFAWAPAGFVWETPEPSRVTLGYTLMRAFAYGQGPATREWSRSPSNWTGVAGWMAIGLAQSLAYGPLALLAFLARTERRAFTYRKFVEGIGKLFWLPLLKPRFYGAARLKRAARAQQFWLKGV
jgi:glycosyltransferase involved in cell wall biosynthesis